MTTTDTSEKGLEALIVAALTGRTSTSMRAEGEVREPTTAYGGAGYVEGCPEDYDRESCVDLAQLSAFLHKTQPEEAEA